MVRVEIHRVDGRIQTVQVKKAEVPAVLKAFAAGEPQWVGSMCVAKFERAELVKVCETDTNAVAEE